MVAAMGATDPDDMATLRTKMVPHPWKAFEEPLRLQNGDAALRIPRTNINCSANLRSSAEADRAKQMAGNRNYEIDTGHDIMVTEPGWLTATLIEIADTPAT
jgi:hypothetical protein